ncbi:putative glycosyltransferase [Tieghemostelium lacteum]|uniref:Putative glycosyltransferase n=1 Tax=Tieghemostelium lacteum TaxID=361077 RepID=A0A151ZF57_TIELA|nr:putative glycosyltransferase [Tieghemostelium lacteum]|eukprot:KYQ92565.1 putative glycosyltransferase [Tieghemostelium lacteum]
MKSIKINKKNTKYIISLIFLFTLIIIYINTNKIKKLNEDLYRQNNNIVTGYGKEDEIFPFLNQYSPRINSNYESVQQWALDPTGAYPKRRVCIVTTEIEGPVLGGGIGTAYTALSQKLLEDGHNVTVILVNQVKKLTPEHWVQLYRSRGIALEILDFQLNLLQMEQQNTADKATLGVIGCTGACIRSYKVYQYLQKRSEHFDIIHFHDNGGMGYFSVLSRHQGLYFKRTLFVIGGHGPHLWERTANSANLDDGKHFEVDYLERKSVELADWLISPSNYMLNWMLSSGWVLPKHSYVHQNLLPGQNQILFLETDLESMKHNFHELVFFGRLESRKGLDIFMNAVEVLAPTFRSHHVSVTFLGANTKLIELNLMADQYIQQRCTFLQVNCSILIGKSHTEAIDYLNTNKDDKLIVVASPIDNSPNTVLECLTHQIPLIATNVGGIPELIHPDDRNRVMFYPKHSSLVKKIQTLLQDGIYPARFSIDEWSRQNIWSNWHSIVDLGNARGVTDKQKSVPRVVKFGIVITFQRNFQQLQEAIESIRLIYGDNENLEEYQYEIIIVQSTFNKELTTEQSQYITEFKRLTITDLLIEPIFQIWNSAELLKFQNTYDYLIIFDYQNQFLIDNPLDIIYNVIKETGADLISSSLQVQQKSSSNSMGLTTGGLPLTPTVTPSTSNSSSMVNSTLVYMGCNGIPGIMYNCYGSNNLIIKTDALVALSKKFPNELDYHFEIDQGGAWELYAEATNQGLLLETIPASLFISHKIEYEVPSTYKQELGVMRSFENILPASFGLTTLATRHFLTSKRIYMAEIISLSQANKELSDRYLKLQQQFERMKEPVREYNETGEEINTYQDQRKHIGLLFIRGHEKSGTSWLKKVINLHPRVFLAPNEFHFHFIQDGISKFTNSPWAASKEPYFSYTRNWYKSFVRHVMLSGVSPSLAPIIEWAGEKTPSPLAPIVSGSKYILIIRDGRDVVVSLFWHYVRLGGFEDWCGPDGKDTPLVDPRFVESYRTNSTWYTQNSQKLLEQEKCFRWIVKGWADRVREDQKTIQSLQTNPVIAQVYEVRYEELHRDPENTRTKMYEFLNLDPLEAEQLSIDDKTAPGGFDEHDPKGKFFRKGEIGDWVNYFTEDNKKWFKEEGGHVLIDLGYEINDSW